MTFFVFPMTSSFSLVSSIVQALQAAKASLCFVDFKRLDRVLDRVLDRIWPNWSWTMKIHTSSKRRTCLIEETVQFLRFLSFGDCIPDWFLTKLKLNDENTHFFEETYMLDRRNSPIIEISIVWRLYSRLISVRWSHASRPHSRPCPRPYYNFKIEGAMLSRF